jgi:hypothetical protein
MPSPSNLFETDQSQIRVNIEGTKVIVDWGRERSIATAASLYMNFLYITLVIQ